MATNHVIQLRLVGQDEAALLRAGEELTYLTSGIVSGPTRPRIILQISEPRLVRRDEWLCFGTLVIQDQA